MTQRYPLQWPAGRPRKAWNTRMAGTFSEASETSGVGRTSKPVSLGTACDRLDRQVTALGGRNPILSSNVELTVSGRPHAGRAAPLDPGVALYFDLKGKPYALACDTYTTVAMNVAALANHIEAMRRIERYGVATAAEMFTAFEALPPPRLWWQTLGFPSGTAITREDIEAAFRKLAAKNHPDVGGSNAAMASLTQARDEGRKAIASIEGRSH